MNSFTIRRLCYLLVICGLPLYWALQSHETVVISPQISQQVIDYAQTHLPLQGTLKMNADGFSYLKIDDDYIHKLFPMLGIQHEGFHKPPYFRSPQAPGAHISVFYVDEHVRPAEIGRTFTFQLKDVRIVQASRNAKYVILEVDAPELEKLRKKYRRSPKLFGHEFHISIAKKDENRHVIDQNRQGHYPEGDER